MNFLLKSEYTGETMKKEWYSAKELVGLAGLPSSPQGINLMARREGWHHRRKLGVQGKAVEYQVDSLPDDVQIVLNACEPGVSYQSQRQDPFLIWVEAYYQLTKDEREKIVTFILREGLAKLISYIDKNSVDKSKIDKNISNNKDSIDIDSVNQVDMDTQIKTIAAQADKTKP